MTSNNPYGINTNSSNANTPNTNPFGINTNGSNGSAPITNPYGNNPYGGTGRYADPYLEPKNASSASVNSYGSRESRPRRRDDLPRRPSNPFEQPSIDRQTPSPSVNPFDQRQNSQSSTADSRSGQGPRPERRGYGGLGIAPGQDRERQQAPAARPNVAGRERAWDPDRDVDRDQDQDYGDNRSRDRRGGIDTKLVKAPPIPALPTPQSLNGANKHPSGRPIRTMEEILRHIQNSWKSMEGDECVPVKVALQLADPSSLGLGHRETDFADTHIDLQKSLRGVVNHHYADFNSAVGTYHKIQSSIRQSQSRVRYLKNGLTSVKGGMLSTRPELRGLAEQSGELDILLNVLAQVENLREMPSKLEEKINEKRWIGAVEVLGQALRSSRRSDLDDIGAVSDLKNYFATQETSLVDMLIEELHDHLYLKSPYCVDRWKGRHFEGSEGNSSETFGGNAWDRPVYRFLAALDMKKPMVEDASKNPEADTFYYIQMLVEALNKLGYLEETVARIESRMPLELYRVADRTNQEVDAIYPSHLRAQRDIKKRPLSLLQPTEGQSNVLSAFLWSLYAKFEAIAEGHRVLHEVILGITERESFSKPEKYTTGFKELWKLYQLEVRTLLHDYLATEGETGLSSSKTAVAGSDVFARRTRDKQKRMFKLAEADQKSADLKAEEDELDNILKTSVPGLVTKSRGETVPNSHSDRGGQDGVPVGHKLLIEPSVFNVTILLPPSLAFLRHLKDIVPHTSNIPMSTLTSFLDELLINIFHPQLEEAVTELCAQCMVDIEAFMEHSQWSRYSPHPIFKGTVVFMSLIRAFSGMLTSIPQDQMFTQLMITQLVRYYDRCHSFYRALVSRAVQIAPNSSATKQVMKAAAGYAAEGDIHDTASALLVLMSRSDRPQRLELMTKEVQDLLTAVKAKPVESYDIISDPKSVHQLSLIYNSMQWLSASLLKLRHLDTTISSDKTHSRNTSASGGQHARRWTLIANLKVPGTTSVATISPSIYLPLNPETAVPFDETLSAFKSLAENALLTLHIDIRCGIIHQLSRSLRPPEPWVSQQGVQPGVQMNRESTSTQSAVESVYYPFVLPAPPTSASPRILELNNDLISFDANISSYLGIQERRFILSGLGRLVDRYLVIGADYIQVMNKEGAERMRVDGMVVQQVLRGLGLGTAISTEKRMKQLSTAEDTAKRADGSSGLDLGVSSLTEQSEAREDDEDALLISSSRFYEMFLQGPNAIMEYVRSKKTANPAQDVGYTYDELRTLIELCFSATLRGDDREESMNAKKRMGDLLLQLGEIMWDS